MLALASTRMLRLFKQRQAVRNARRSCRCLTEVLFAAVMYRLLPELAGYETDYTHSPGEGRSCASLRLCDSRDRCAGSPGFAVSMRCMSVLE